MKKRIGLIFCCICIVICGFVSGMFFQKTIYNLNLSGKDSIEGDGAQSEKLEVPLEELDESIESNEYDLEYVDRVLNKDFSLSSKLIKIEPSFGSPWKYDISGTKKMCIEGRGLESIEDGEGHIYINNGSETYSISLADKGSNLAPIYVEWIDDETIYVLMGDRHEFSSRGTALYELNLSTLETFIVYQANENEEILEATKIDDDINNIKMLEHNEEAAISVEKNIKFN